MRKILVLLCVALGVTALSLVSGMWTPPGAHAASGGRSVAPLAGTGPGDFIIRCFYNGNVAPQDPIDAPGSFHTDHLHIFFGNLASGAAAADNTAFPDMQSGDYATSGDTMEVNGLKPATNCQDTKDTAGYWVPEPYLVTSAGSPSVLPTLGAGCPTPTNPTCTAGGAHPDFYQREYYLPTGGGASQEIPDGTIMIAGYPLGCATVNGVTPTGCSSTGSPGYPVDVGVTGIPPIVEYTCGADTVNGQKQFTPVSAWPYSCANYTDSDDDFSDGVVAVVNFPYCWNGRASFPAPNSPAVNGLPAQLVPGYLPPWIPTPSAWQAKYPSMSPPANDFAYPPNGGVSCDPSSSYPIPVVQLSERIHLLVSGANWGAPSTCTSDTGVSWNSLGNPENSPNANPNDADAASDVAGGGQADATVEVNKNPVVWGFHKCIAAGSPTLSGTPGTLSFACTPASPGPGDPNCTIPLPSPPNPAGCGTSGTCYTGAYTYGWETLHADYWQTWQEASAGNGNLDNTPPVPPNTQPTDGVASDVGTFGDLVDDCADANLGACSFINSADSTPAKQVYGPPPP